MRALTVLLALTLGSVAVFAENWPNWRGPHGTGINDEHPLPTRWGKDENIAWRAPLRGLGVSGPIVWGNRVFLTSQLGMGELREGRHPTLVRGEDTSAERPLGEGRELPSGSSAEDVVFLVEAFDRADGHRLWEYRLPAEAVDGELPPVHSKHNLASPSPVTDGAHVYAWFGTGQLVALDMDGKLAWERHLGKEYAPFVVSWGHASSPTLYQDTLFLLCDHDNESYLLALDKRTGKEIWKNDRGQGMRSYSTPFVVRGAERNELIVNSSKRVEAFDPTTGKLLWYTGESNRFPIPVPSYDDGVLYMSRGYRSGPYMAVRPGGTGDVSSSHVLWRVPTGAPYVSSILYYQGLIYMANGAGIVTCVDGRTGERVWQERMDGIFSASPVAGDGKVYLLAESGEMIVLAAGRKPEVLARSSVGERSLASPALADGQIFIRTDGHLFCVGKSQASTTSSGRWQ
jgi:outer membrane protein assembly factor BamB